MRSRILPQLGAIRLASLRTTDVQNWIAGMQEEGLSPSRVRQGHVLLSSMLADAVHDNRIARNVASGARLPRMERTEAAYFDPRTVDCLVADLPSGDSEFVALQGSLACGSARRPPCVRSRSTYSADEFALRSLLPKSGDTSSSARRRAMLRDRCLCRPQSRRLWRYTWTIKCLRALQPSRLRLTPQA